MTNQSVRACVLVFSALCCSNLSFALEGGYASATSVAQGGSINFHISTQAVTYSITIYREGFPRMLMKRITGLAGAERQCPEPGYSAGCGWPVSYQLQVPTSWPSGVYMAEFSSGSNGQGTLLINFVVREDNPGSTSPVFVTLASNTHNAYNNVGGKSLYNSGSSNDIPARIVSYNRPYKSPGDGTYFKREHPFVDWAERMGYSLEYGTNVDLHRDPTLLANYACFVTLGHDEYWTREMRDNLDAFTGSGGNALILSGNTCWWQVRLSADLRTMYGYKGFALSEDPFATDGTSANDYLVTTNWYRPPVNYPENSTTGLGWRDGGYHDYGSSFPASQGYGGYKVYRTGHWVFGGAGLSDDQMLGQAATIVGYEVDGTPLEARDGAGNLAWDANGYYPAPGALPYVVDTANSKTPANFVVLGVAPGTRGHAVMGIFDKAGGGRVFNAGTIDWIQGLATDAAVARITTNLLKTLGTLDPVGNLSPTATILEASPPQAAVGAPVTLRGQGTDSDGTIAAFAWRSSIDGFLSDQANHTTTGLSQGVHTIFFRVLDDDGKWSSEAQATVGVLASGAHQVVIDNGQAGTSSTGGTWAASGGDNPYGGGSVYSKNAGATYSFHTNLPGAGDYDVFLWWTQFSSRLTNVPVVITHGSGTTTVTVNQQLNGGQWNRLGGWTFGADATVTIQSLGGGSTNADAVCFSLVGPPNAVPNATIEDISPDPATPGAPVEFRGHGTDSDGTVVAYEWRSSRDGVLSTQAVFTSSSLSTGVHTIYFKVKDDDNAWSPEVQGTLTIAGGSGPVEVILDNGQPGTSKVGYWPVSGGTGYYGTNSLYSKEVGARYNFALTLPQSGTYEVQLWWTAFASRLTQVPVNINHSGGTAQVFVNQKVNGGQWNAIGTWSFGSPATIQIESPGGGTACADAVRVVRIGP